MTKIITAAEVTTDTVLVTANGRKAFVSLVTRNATQTIIRANGSIAAMPHGRKLRVQA